MEPSDTFCAKFDIGDRSFYVLSTWDHDNYELKITDGDEAWALAVPPDEVAQEARGHSLDMPKYLELTRNAWKCKSTSRVQEYRFELMDDRALKLTWKMLVSEEEKDPEQFELLLDKGPSRLKHAIITYLVDHASKIQDAMRSFQRAQGLMEEEVARCRDRLAAVKRDKEQVERELYGKFAQVLNAKKAKICDLRQKLSEATGSDMTGSEGDENVKEEEGSQESFDD